MFVDLLFANLLVVSGPWKTARQAQSRCVWACRSVFQVELDRCGLQDVDNRSQIKVKMPRSCFAGPAAGFSCLSCGYSPSSSRTLPSAPHGRSRTWRPANRHARSSRTPRAA
jgi:hypothetical protein